jgi:hypothetical protein
MDEVDEKYAEYMFKRVMQYLHKGEVKNAAMSFLSDCNKRGINLGFFTMVLLTTADKNMLLNVICGFPWQPNKIKAYYDNQDKAFIDYPRTDGYKKRSKRRNKKRSKKRKSKSR